jgi:hypothetical protein
LFVLHSFRGSHVCSIPLVEPLAVGWQVTQGLSTSFVNADVHGHLRNGKVWLKFLGCGCAQNKWRGGLKEHAAAVRQVCVTRTRYKKTLKETTSLMASLDAMRCRGWEERLVRYCVPVQA